MPNRLVAALILLASVVASAQDVSKPSLTSRLATLDAKVAVLQVDRQAATKAKNGKRAWDLTREIEAFRTLRRDMAPPPKKAVHRTKPKRYRPWAAAARRSHEAVLRRMKVRGERKARLDRLHGVQARVDPAARYESWFFWRPWLRR